MRRVACVRIPAPPPSLFVHNSFPYYLQSSYQPIHSLSNYHPSLYFLSTSFPLAVFLLLIWSSHRGSFPPTTSFSIFARHPLLSVPLSLSRFNSYRIRYDPLRLATTSDDHDPSRLVTTCYDHPLYQLLSRRGPSILLHCIHIHQTNMILSIRTKCLAFGQT
ncbi:hypothetical protein FRC14_004016 [Serendipita sp. 396]|nr:hypothetical protein FRC14_004016 [Serendipita sp. 396]